MSGFFQPCGSKPLRTEIDLYRSRVVPTAFSTITSLQDLQQETAHSAGAQFLGRLPWQQFGDSIPIQSVTRSPTACSLYILYSGGLPGFKPVSHPIFAKKIYTKGHCAYTTISTLQAAIKESSPHFPSRLQHPWHPAKTRYAKGGTSGLEKLQQLLLCLGWQKKVLNSKTPTCFTVPTILTIPIISHHLQLFNFTLKRSPFPSEKYTCERSHKINHSVSKGLSSWRSERDGATDRLLNVRERKQQTKAKTKLFDDERIHHALYDIIWNDLYHKYHTTLLYMVWYHIIFYQYYTHYTVSIYKSSLIDIPSPVYKKIYFAGLARCCCFAS